MQGDREEGLTLSKPQDETAPDLECSILSPVQHTLASEFSRSGVGLDRNEFGVRIQHRHRDGPVPAVGVDWTYHSRSRLS